MNASTELSDLRWVAMHILISHDRAALRLANAVPEALLDKVCPCSLCRTARPWVGMPEAEVCNPAEDAIFEEMDARQRAGRIVPDEMSGPTPRANPAALARVRVERAGWDEHVRVAYNMGGIWTWPKSKMLAGNWSQS